MENDILEKFTKTTINRKASGIVGAASKPDPKLKRLTTRIRTCLKSKTAPYPWLFYPAYFALTWRGFLKMPPVTIRRRGLFKNDYDLLVDGYWRSANTFVSAAISQVAPSIRVRSHCHSPLYVFEAVRSGKPAVVLIRKPEDAIASLVLHSGISLEEAIEEYIAYYIPITKLSHKVLITRFEDVVIDINSVIKNALSALGSSKHAPSIQNDDLRAIYQKVAAYPWGKDPLSISLPVPARQEHANQLRENLQKKQYVQRLSKANLVYNNCTKTLSNSSG